MRQTLASSLTIVFILGTLVGFLATKLRSARASTHEAVGATQTESERPPRRQSTAHEHPTILLAKELESSRKQTDRYRDGLERAVDELNRMARECSPEVPHTLPVAEEWESEKPAKKGKSSLRLKGLKLQPWEEDLVAFGSIENRGEGDEVAELLLELVHDGRVIDEEQLSFNVIAGDEITFEHTFWAGKLEGTYRIRGKLLS